MTITDSADAAIDDLYRAHGVALIRFALMLTGDQDTAEDVVQEAFIGLYRGWHRISDPGSALAYLRAAVVNGARSAHRSRQRARARLLRVARHDPPIPDRRRERAVHRRREQWHPGSAGGHMGTADRLGRGRPARACPPAHR